MDEKQHTIARFRVVSYELLHHRKTILITKFRGDCGTRSFEHDRNPQQKFSVTELTPAASVDSCHPLPIKNQYVK